MNELTEICGLSATQVGAAPAETLVDCTNVVQALLLPGAELALVIGFLVIGALVGLGVRHRARLSTAAIVGGVFESGLYAAAGAYFGSFGGLLYAELAGPTAMGVVMLAFALVAVAGVVLGLWHGDGGAGGKAGGVIVMLLFAGLFVGGAAAAFTVDDADSHALFLNLMALGFGTLAGFSALLVGLFRAMHPALGWLVIPVVSSWGLVGTTLGVLMHFGSWLFNADAGRRNTHADYAYNGLGMVVYDNGFRVKAGYAYTSGAVVTASSKKMIWHEAVHVLQHILFGSVFPVSYVVWAALLGLAGMIAGAHRRQLLPGRLRLGVHQQPVGGLGVQELLARGRQQPPAELQHVHPGDGDGVERRRRAGHRHHVHGGGAGPVAPLDGPAPGVTAQARERAGMPAGGVRCTTRASSARDSRVTQ